MAAGRFRLSCRFFYCGLVGHIASGEDFQIAWRVQGRSGACSSHSICTCGGSQFAFRASYACEMIPNPYIGQLVRWGFVKPQRTWAAKYETGALGHATAPPYANPAMKRAHLLPAHPASTPRTPRQNPASPPGTQIQKRFSATSFFQEGYHDWEPAEGWHFREGC